jgi:rfaE bifunctional protein kinase chain/domain
MSLLEPSFSTPRLLVVGDAMLDCYWDGSVERISPEAPVPVLHVRHRYERAGGAANVAVNLRGLGCDTILLSLIGADKAGARLIELLNEADVAVAAPDGAGFRTLQKIRCVSQHHQLMRLDHEDEPPQAAVESIGEQFQTHILQTDAVLLSDYGKGTLGNCAQLIEIAKSAGKPVLVDPKGQDYGRYCGATLVKPNWKEFVAVAGQPVDDADFHRRGQLLRESLKLRYLLVTQGEKGMTLFDDDGIHYEQATAREVFDVSGAGDTVAAVLGWQIAIGNTLKSALTLANKAAGIAVSKFGTSTVSLTELLA